MWQIEERLLQCSCVCFTPPHTACAHVCLFHVSVCVYMCIYLCVFLCITPQMHAHVWESFACCFSVGLQSVSLVRAVITKPDEARINNSNCQHLKEGSKYFEEPNHYTNEHIWQCLCTLNVTFNDCKIKTSAQSFVGFQLFCIDCHLHFIDIAKINPLLHNCFWLTFIQPSRKHFGTFGTFFWHNWLKRI